MNLTTFTNPGQPYLNGLLSFMIRERQNELVKETLQRSHLYYVVDPSGATLLHYCARHGNEDIAQFLLNENCHLDAQDYMGNTPLTVAIQGTNETIIQILITAGADIFLLNNEKKSALHMLLTNNQISSSTCKLLLQEFRRKCSTSEEAAEKLIETGYQVYLAAYSLDFKLIEHMLARGCPVDSVHPVRKRTAMHVAVHFADLDTAQLLLKSGADAKFLDAKNASFFPLRYLYQNNEDHHPNKIELLKILLNLGVSPTNCTVKGNFDIGPTLRRGNREAIRIILQSRQLDFSVRDVRNGETVLHYLARNTNPEVVKELKLQVNIKYDVTAVSKVHGYSVLYTAAHYGNVDMVKFLLSRGAESNTYVCAPIYYAYTRSKPHIQKRYDECVELLFQHDADPQYILVRPSGEVITVFDIALRTNEFYRVEPAIAQLSLREKRGVPFTIFTRRRIRRDPKLIEYLKECRRLIETKIFQSITFYKLVTCRPNKMERYLNNKQLWQKLALFNRRNKMKSSHAFLFNTLRKRYREGKEYRKLKLKVTRGICKIMGNGIGKNHFIVDTIVSYLDIYCLRQVAQL